VSLFTILLEPVLSYLYNLSTQKREFQISNSFNHFLNLGQNTCPYLPSPSASSSTHRVQGFRLHKSIADRLGSGLLLDSRRTSQSTNSASPRTLSNDQKLLNNLFLTAFLAAKNLRMSRTLTDNTGSFNVSNSYNNVITVTATDDESKIMAWLSPLGPQVRHQDICSQRIDDIGGWLLETEEFINWYNGSSRAVLFCYGNPGAGKSYIWYE